MNRQNFTCATADCLYSTDEDDGCTKGSITIEEHHCVDYEKAPKAFFAVVVSGGMVQRIYSSCAEEDVKVEILDYDRYDGEVDMEQLENRERALKSEFPLIY